MDPISDFLNRIKNAQRVKKETVSFGYSKLKWEIAKILEQENYCMNVVRKGKKNRKLIEISLLYTKEGGDIQPKILDVKRVSKPSRRVYRSVREIHPVKNGFGMAIYSTPKGLMTNREAIKTKTGGELLFEIW